MHGRDVRVLQDFLTRVGVKTPVDGQYGPTTARRVRTWERRSSLRVNGRLPRREAALLRGQVNAGTGALHGGTGGATPAAPAPAPAPVAAPVPVERATLGRDGLAIAPASAPDVVKQVIAAANEIVGKPYRYGGGHGRWIDTGYDCSGSESYALHGGGLLDTPLDSTAFMSFGEPGPGTWITSYANPGHSYMVVAGLRFDTGWNNSTSSGPKWSTVLRSGDGFTARHPAGL